MTDTLRCSLCGSYSTGYETLEEKKRHLKDGHTSEAITAECINCIKKTVIYWKEVRGE